MSGKFSGPVRHLACFSLVLCAVAGCDRPGERDQSPSSDGTDAAGAETPGVRQELMRKSPPIVAAARWQVGRTVDYDGRYARLAYPGGDVPIETGVCTDVVVRALRMGLKMDLQKLVNEDMRAAFSAYPKNWADRRPNRNIDHRRVPTLRRYFERKR